MDRQPSLCQHPFMDDTTYHVWYEVPCGIPIGNPENKADILQSKEAAVEYVKETGHDIPWMMRAWCPICRTWKEPLLSIDGAHYFGDELS